MLSFGLDFVWTIINLVILYLLLNKFLIGPVTAVMEKRKQTIDASFAQAKKVTAEADELKEKWQAAMDNVDEESMKEIERAKERADKEYNRIIAQANERSDKIIKEAQETIALEREQAVKDAENEIATLAIAAAAKIAAAGSGEAENQALYNHYIQAGGVNDTNGN